MCLALNPQNMGHPNAARHLDEAMLYILGRDCALNTTADDIAEYYIAIYSNQVLSWWPNEETDISPPTAGIQTWRFGF
jgi:hypothetical protein